MKFVIFTLVVLCVSPGQHLFTEAWNLPGASTITGLLENTQVAQRDVNTQVAKAPQNATSKWSLGGALSGSINAATNLAGTALNTTKQVTGTVTNGIKGVATTAIGTAKDVATAAIDLALLASEKAINVGVSFFLTSYRNFVKLARLDEMPLPPIITWPYFIASFEARNGFFKSLSSLSKDGSILIRRNGTSLKIDIPLKFDDLEVGYKNYSWSVARLGTSGSFSVGIKSNKVRLTLVLNLSTKCAINLERISFLDMEGIEVKFTGFCHYCGAISSKIATFIVNYVQSTVKNLIQDKLDSLMKSTLKQNSMICAKFLTG